jgi:hypothetical protein
LLDQDRTPRTHKMFVYYMPTMLLATSILSGTISGGRI